MTEAQSPQRKRIVGENNLAYGAIHPFPLPGWEPADLVRLKGKNWQVIFIPDGIDYIETERGMKIVDHHLEGPNVFIAGTERFSDPGEATLAQKPIIDSIRGLFLLEGPPGKPVLLPAVWEGVFKKSSPDRITYEGPHREATWLGVKKIQLEHWGAYRQAFDPFSSPPELAFGLRWFYKGMMGLHGPLGERIDAFVSLWICTITLVRAWHVQNIGGDPSEMQRFRAYAEQRLGLSGIELDDLKGQFELVRDKRNQLFKGGGSMVVSEDEATAAAALAHGVLYYEVVNVPNAFHVQR